MNPVILLTFIYFFQLPSLDEINLSRIYLIDPKVTLNCKDFKSRMMQSDSSNQIMRISNCFLICGSFLIPKNAENQIAKLKKAGFSKTYLNIFPESEYYSVVVDTFKEDESIKQLIIVLSTMKYDYFTKCLYQ